MSETLKDAICASDAARVSYLLTHHPDLRTQLDNPLPDYGFGIHALYAAVQRSDRATIQVLLDAGADIHKRTEWWAGGFGLLDECDPDLVSFLLERGAVIDAHSASRLGMTEELSQMLSLDPALVHARGGDGQTPLHFASTIKVARLLLQNGAAIDARDLDHESTPAQYMLRVEHKRHYPHQRQDVARYLVSQGCRTDILMAAALGDKTLVEKHLDLDPACIYMNVSDDWFPKVNPASGGSIYIWVLGKHRTAHTVARDFVHEDVFHILMDRTPPNLKLTLACELGDETVFQEMLRTHPELTTNLSEQHLRKLPNAAENNNTEAVRLMLSAGWPVNTPGAAGATALHWAGFHGNAEMTAIILRHHPDLELKSRDYPSPALSWAVFGSGNGWHRDTGNYVSTVQALLKAGAAPLPAPETLNPSPSVLKLLTN